MSTAYQIALEDLANREPDTVATIFSQGNGTFGVRATDPLLATDGTVVNGFFETSPIIYGEAAHGYAKEHQTIVSLPSLRHLTIIDQAGQPAATRAIKDVRLDMQTGALTMTTEIVFPDDDRPLELTTTSLIGQADQDLTAYLLGYTLTTTAYEGMITFTKGPLVFQEKESDIERDPRVVVRPLQLKHAIIDSSATAVVQRIQTTESQLTRFIKTSNVAGLTQTVKVAPAQPAHFEAYVQVAQQDSFALDLDAAVAQRTKAFWHQFWASAAIDITGDDKMAQGLHFNVFQLAQSANRTGEYSIAAKGVSGPGYEGHFFWDTEMYMLPFFTYTHPEIARKLLEFRYRQLPLARKRAHDMGVAQGGLFPWRSINGAEASAFFPAGTAQYHIDADIAYAVAQYFDVTQDKDFMEKFGLPILWETAQFWRSFGAWSERDGRRVFMFHDVTGPDEYTALVDNNTYTNRMAKANIENFLSAYAQLDVSSLLDIEEADLQALKDIAAGIYLPEPGDNGVTAQDDTFLSKPIWPFATTPADHYPLLLHYHPLTIYRYQVSKQPDELMLDMLFPDDKAVSQKKIDYAYYERLATHDSSLSRSAYAVLAANLGDTEKAYHYFMDSALLDLTDLQGNTKDGLHMANLGGSWMSAAYGFAGLKVVEGQLSISNRLPAQWQTLALNLLFRGRQLHIVLTHDNTVVTLLAGEPLTLAVDDQEQEISRK
ncbi:glycoside hydrolase family 65 protein [Lacticaseibacillus yichunensis]|uniref:Glycoside hydrolase family 65 protein n=1 Tax=Lacticaseibacillus yichunensis TaxID=2486015 RepID=A0ABW4CVB0_9LACO|nr:glycosyl hydrolase family 65 protein [Lacticaseibacillus yichunensis]